MADGDKTADEMQAERERDTLFAAAMENVGEDGSNYLGDPATIDAILRMGVANVLLDDAVDATEEDVTKLIEAESLSVAKELLGQGKAKPVPGWNEPGGIDVFLVQHVGTTETEPVKVVQAFFVELLIEQAGLQGVSQQPGILEEQWAWEVQASFDAANGLARGIAPDVQEWLSSQGDDGEPLDDDEPADDIPPAPEGMTRTQEALVRRWEEYP